MRHPHAAPLRHPGRLAGALALALAGMALAAGAGAADLPPPPRSTEAVPDLPLHLELVINRSPSGKVVSVLRRDDHYFVLASDLKAAGVRLDSAVPIDRGRVAVDALPGVQVDYDTAQLRLLIDVPPAWLPEQQLEHGRTARKRAVSSTGLLLNYDLYATSPAHGPSRASASLGLRAFGPLGVLSSTGIWQDGGAQSSRYMRYDTSWSYSDEDRMLTWEAGDLITRGPAWSSAVRMGGFQLSRDFSLRPDIVTYPLPQFAGQSAVPGAVDLFINGYRSSRDNVAPGPFVLNSVPFINGAGEAQIVVTDALGRQVTTTVPFYVSSALLKPGLSDYALGVGAIRRDYGLRDFAYGEMAAHGTWRYGLTNWLTLETHGEAARSFGLGGVGSVLRLGRAGVLDAAWSGSRHEGRAGSQSTVGYQYNNRRFTLSAQYNRRSDGFADLSAIDQAYSLRGRNTSLSASGSLSLGRYGSLGMGWFDVRPARASRTRLLNLSYGLPLWGNNYLSVSANREVGGGQWSAVLQLLVPLGGNRGTLYGSVEHNGDRGDTHRLNYSRSIPSQGGFGWNLAASHTDGSDTYHQADLEWRNDRVQLSGGLYGNDRDMTGWAGASGAFVLMDGSVFASNQVRDAFVVVDTAGYRDIPVRYENQIVGTTGAGGRLLVPWAGAWYDAKYEIDPMQLPPYVETPLVEQRVAVRRGGGYLLRFPVKRVVAASVTLHDEAGQPLPVASEVTLDDGRQMPVGWDGLVYLDGLQARNRLAVSLPDGRQCAAEFPLDVEREQVAQIGPLVCR